LSHGMFNQSWIEARREVKRRAVRARHGDQIDLRAKTEDRLGNELGVSGVTMKRDAACERGVDMIAEAVSAEAAAKVRSSEVKITKPQVAKIGRAKSTVLRATFELSCSMNFNSLANTRWR
jgi:hypothetical protein